MNCKHINEMIIDWMAMGYKFNNTAQEYYLNNYNNIKLNRDTRFILEVKLGLLEFDSGVSEGCVEYWMTLSELKKHMESGNTNEGLNDVLKPVCNKYNIDFNNYDI